MKFQLMIAACLVCIAAVAQPTPGSQLFPVRTQGVWGYMNNEGKVVIVPQYQAADYFYEGLAAVKKEGKWGFIDSKNKVIIPFEHDTVQHFSEGWCPVGYREEGMPLQWGFISSEGKTLATALPALGYATPFNNNRAMVSQQGFDEPFLINRKGETVLKQGEFYFFTEEGHNRYYEGIMKVMKPITTDGMYKTLFIDTAGRVLTQFNSGYGAYGSFHNGMMWYKDNLKYGFMDQSGKEVIPAKYDTVMDFSEGWACVWDKMNFEPNAGRLEGGVSGYINTLGEWVLEPKARESYGFHEGFARVRKNGKWGYMNTSGTIVIPLEYDAAEDFFRGFARVSQNGKWHYLNTRGKVVWSEPTE